MPDENEVASPHVQVYLDFCAEESPDGMFVLGIDWCTSNKLDLCELL